MGPEALAQVLRPLRDMFDPAEHPDLLVGLQVSDDAAVYRISDDIAVIQTLDFFTPIVDDPYDYGAIAAANAMSDVYAMGGEVVLALNIAAFPDSLPLDMASEILRGGAEKVCEAGAVLAGGHTISDDEPKYGMAVMGTIHPQRIMTKGGAVPGDVLVLTKPLGVGMVTTAAKGDVAEPEHLAEAVASMKRLNRRAAALALEADAHAVTDVTGFSLLGHAHEMAERSDACLQFSFKRLPFVSGAKAYAEDWLFPEGSCNNQRAFEKHVSFDASISEEMQTLLFTPETSGGLLIAVPSEKAHGVVENAERSAVERWVVGSVVAGSGVVVQP